MILSMQGTDSMAKVLSRRAQFDPEDFMFVAFFWPGVTTTFENAFLRKVVKGRGGGFVTIRHCRHLPRHARTAHLSFLFKDLRV
jgi:hypothetical protein